jgi:hypothetical protein
MATDPGNTQIWAAIGAWFATIAAGIFGYGRLNAKVENHDEEINGIKSMFVDADGNPRLMTVLGHQEVCHSNTDALKQRIETLCGKIELWHKEDIQGREEMSKRVSAIEKSVVAIETELRIRNEKEK